MTTTQPTQKPLPPKKRLRMLGELLTAALGRRRTGTFPALATSTFPPTVGGVEIVRDQNGVPHVYAEDERDLYSALGYLQAADRFLFLDLIRHIGAGRVCELVTDVPAPKDHDLLGGKKLADLDGFVRPLGFEREARRDFERLSPRGRDCITAFCDGVNAALRATKGHYPAEYLALGRVRPWEPSDCLLMARTSAFIVSLVNFENELTFDAVRASVGDDIAKLVYPDAPWHQCPTSYPAKGTPPPSAPLHVPAGGSNNWAVAAERSESGAPLLANDPHVPVIPLPTYWYHVHLECPTYRVQGGLFPGCPAFGYGHNGYLAWGCTTGFRDAWDFYRVHRSPEDPQSYKTVDGTGRIRRHNDRLDVRFRRSRMLRWESCEHGIIYNGWKHHDGTDLAVRFAEADLAAYVDGYLELAEATDVEEHRGALAKINDGPFDFNHVYAHRDGHIGWELFGALPKRAADGLFVRDAHDPAGVWNGPTPFAEMPKKLAPASGQVATANSVVDPDDFERIASRVHFEPRYRQDRIESLLGAREKHSVESFCEIQADVGSDYSVPVRDALLRSIASLAGEGGQIGFAVAALTGWDGRFVADHPAPALFVLTRKELAHGCFAPLLGGEVAPRYLGGRRAIPRLHDLLADAADPLRTEICSAAGADFDTLVERAFRAAVARVVEICGYGTEKWSWGAIQRARLGTLLGEIPGLGARFTTLDEGFPGDDWTVSAANPLDEGSRLRVLVGASSRFVCDLAEPDTAWFAHSSGPSGDASSPYFSLLSRSWQRFEYFRSELWEPDDVPDPIERVRIEPRW